MTTNPYLDRIIILIQQRIAELNRLWSICPTLSWSGVQQSLKDRQATRISCLVDKGPPDTPFLINKTIRVKLSGESIRIVNRLHIVNLTFTFLDEGDATYSATAVKDHIIVHVTTLPLNTSWVAI